MVTGSMKESATVKLEVDQVTKDYGERKVLSPTNLTVGENEFISIVGPSGCGKSTLLMMMAGLLEPTSGQIRFGDRVISGPPKRLAVVFQDYSRSLFPWLTVRRNCPWRPRRTSWRRRRWHAVSTMPWRRSACPARKTSTRGSCPAACSSASRSRERWRCSPRCC